MTKDGLNPGLNPTTPPPPTPLINSLRRQRRGKLLKSTCKKERSADAKHPTKKAKRERTGDASTVVEGEGHKSKKKPGKSEKDKGAARGKGSVVDGKGPTPSGGKRAGQGAAAVPAVAGTTGSAKKNKEAGGRKGSAENLTRLPASSRSALPSTTPPAGSATTASGNRLHLRTAPPLLVLPHGAAGVPQREGAEESPRAADGSGSGGRRARAPSRKLLEASGRVADEGVQLLTKAKKEEENRLKREMKEQRRAAKSAGLKLGEVIEATAVPLSEESGSGGGGDGGGSRGSGGGSDAFSVGEASPSWRKLSPSDMLRAAQQQQQEEQQPAEAGSKQRPLSTKDSSAKSGAVSTVGKKRERPSAPAAAPETGGSKPAKRDGVALGTPSQRHGKTSVRTDDGKGSKHLRLSDGSGGGGVGSRGGKGHDSTSKRRSPRGHEGEGERGGKTGGGTVCGKVLCEVDACFRPASYGIGDTARLW